MAHMMIQVILNIAVVTKFNSETQGLRFRLSVTEQYIGCISSVEMDFTRSVSNYEGLRYGGQNR